MARSRTETAAAGGRGRPSWSDPGSIRITRRLAADSDDSPWDPPDLVLGRYRLRRPLGAGAFGTVWLAQDERLVREVAIKVIPAANAAVGRQPEDARAGRSGEAGRRAARYRAREAIAAARLNHPGIVMLYEAGEEGDTTYLVSELVVGETLADLYGDGALSDRDVLCLGVALCDALAHAHAQGVIHRDVKPSNVIVPDEPAQGAGIAKLTDFGVAHVAGGELLTRTGDVVGTLAYMAPEQAEGEQVTPAADLYSLALVLYEGLAGDNPVRAATPAATARRLGRPLPSLTRRRRDLPPELCAAIDQALHPHPEGRGTLAELRQALSEWTSEVSDEDGRIGRNLLEGWRRPAIVRPADRLVAAVSGTALAAVALARLPAPPHAPAPAIAAAAGLLVALLPRLGWLLAAWLTVFWQLGPAQHPGTALVLLAALAGPPLLLWRRGPMWSLPAAAPVLGLLTLAGAWPGVAAFARSAYRRAALGALGYWWLTLAQLLLGRDLYVPRPSGVLKPVHWEQSITSVSQHAFGPLFSSPVLLGALVWAGGAAVLPWLVRGRSLPLDIVLATTWAAGLAGAASALAPGGHGLAAGAIVAGVLALVRVWGRVETRDDSAAAAPLVP
jgi:eukaryotic-like serine/threonine-protein kinase